MASGPDYTCMVVRGFLRSLISVVFYRNRVALAMAGVDSLPESFERRGNRPPSPPPLANSSRVQSQPISENSGNGTTTQLLALIWTRMTTCIMMAFSMACISQLVWALHGVHVAA